MASTFAVHVDKENATPALFHKPPAGSVKAFGPQKGAKSFAQATPRKALFDVNQVQPLPGKGPVKEQRGGLSLKENVFHPVKPTLSNRPGAENKPPGLSLKKNSVNELKEPKKTVSHLQKPKKEVRIIPPKKPEPAVTIDEDGYDSDTIFPRKERLSTYVDKLFSWRPPCLFGTIPDSESDNSDHEEEWTPLEIILDDVPIDLPDFPMPVLSPLELPDFLADLPLTEGSNPISSLDYSLESPDLSLSQTPDTSLTFGNLNVMNNSNTQSSDTEHEKFDKGC